MAEFKLPDLGEGVAEAEIERWLVKEGDAISEDDPLVEVMTDKVSAEISSPHSGVVARIHVRAGEVAAVGTTLVSIETVSSADSSPEARDTQAATTAAGSGRAMPPVRKLASELEVDLSTLPGRGPGGRVLLSDVERQAAVDRHPASRDRPSLREAPVSEQPGEAPAADAAASTARREPLVGVRRAVAMHMAEAHRVVPPVTHVEECDVTELDTTRRLHNESARKEARITFLPFIVKAAALGLKKHPALNASLDEDAGEIVYHDRYDIGVAVDTPAGLVVPVVRSADTKSLDELAVDIERLACGARSSDLKAEDFRAPTFTVTSPGRFGGLMATPIVFYPQSAILGVHKASDRPVVRDGEIVVRKMMNLSITFDHRILDGMTAAKFALDVIELLEQPAVFGL